MMAPLGMNALARFWRSEAGRTRLCLYRMLMVASLCCVVLGLTVSRLVQLNKALPKRHLRFVLTDAELDAGACALLCQTVLCAPRTAATAIVVWKNSIIVSHQQPD